MIRHQLPARSPLPIGAIARAGVAAIGGGSAPLDRLQARLAARYTADRVALTASGTHALQLALMADSTPKAGGALVALPAWGCFDLATAAVGAGVDVTFYDLDPETLGPEPDSFAEALDAGAHIAVVAPLFGLPLDWDALTENVSGWDGLLVEDAAQGHGASWRGRPLGSLGHVSVLSFGRGKGWTGGGGGALLARGKGVRVFDLAPLPAAPPAADGWRIAAVLSAAWFWGRPALYGLPARVPMLGLGDTRYRPPSPPAGMSAVAARMILNTESDAEREADVRRENAAHLLAALDSAHGLGRPPALAARPPDGARPGYLRLPFILADELRVRPDRARLAALGAMPGYPALLHELPALRHRTRVRAAGYPGAEDLRRRLATLPTHSLVSARDIARLATALTGLDSPPRAAAVSMPHVLRHPSRTVW